MAPGVTRTPINSALSCGSAMTLSPPSNSRWTSRYWVPCAPSTVTSAVWPVAGIEAPSGGRSVTPLQTGGSTGAPYQRTSTRPSIDSAVLCCPGSTTCRKTTSRSSLWAKPVSQQRPCASDAQAHSPYLRTPPLLARRRCGSSLHFALAPQRLRSKSNEP